MAFFDNTFVSTSLQCDYVHPWIPTVTEPWLELSRWELVDTRSVDKEAVMSLAANVDEDLIPPQSLLRRQSQNLESRGAKSADACLVIRSEEQKPVRVNFTDALRQTIDSCLSTSDKPTAGDSSASSKCHITNNLDIPIVLHGANGRKVLVQPHKRQYVLACVYVVE